LSASTNSAVIREALQWYTEGAGDELAPGVVHMGYVLDAWRPRQVGQLLTSSAANHMRRQIQVFWVFRAGRSRL